MGLHGSERQNYDRPSSLSMNVIFSMDWRGVSLNKKWGFINEKGMVVIAAQFDEVRDFLNDLAPIRMAANGVTSIQLDA